MTNPRGYLVLANDQAGRLRQDDPLSVALDALRAAGPTETAWVADTGDIDAALRRADGRTIVVAGGDGSLNRVVNALLRMGGTVPGAGTTLGGGAPPEAGAVPETGALPEAGAAAPAVGVLPLGTGNDVCRGLGLPLDPLEAAEAIVAGTPRPAPVLETSLGVAAVNAVHLGLGARAAERAAKLKRWAGPLAYLVGGVVEGAVGAGARLHVEVDGIPLAQDEQVLLLAVSNGPSVGGGTPLAPGAELTEPVAEVRVVGQLARRARFGFGWALVRGRIDSHPAVRRSDGRRVTVASSDGSELPVNLDGELLRAATLEVALRPAAWSVVVPPAG